MSVNGENENNYDQNKKFVGISKKEQRHLKAEQNKHRSTWFGLGTIGMVGWQIVLPILMGIFIGTLIDNMFPDGLPWTILLMIVGALIGSVNTWRWLMKQQNEIEKARE